MKRLFAVLAALALAGCSANSASNLIKTQHPGTATGAGATLTGPTNAATPTTQTAERSVEFYAPEWVGQQMSYPVEAIPTVYTVAPDAFDAGDIDRPTRVTPFSSPSPSPRPRVMVERVTTTIGQHQDAAGIIAQVAKAAHEWGWLRWVGVACILAGVAGWLWSVGNPGGYPVVFLGVAGCGVLFVFAAANPAWLLVILLPVGFYGAQKLGVVRALS